MYGIVYAQSARKALKKHRRSGSFPEDAFREMLTVFIQGGLLDARFRDHALHGEMSSERECHLGFDLLVVYKKNVDLEIVTISEVGTHRDIFGE